MTKDNALEKDQFENLWRNIAGVVSTTLGVGAGILIAALVLSVSNSKIQGAFTLALAISFALYADAYHRSIVNSMTIRRLCIGMFVATLPASFLVAWLSKFMPQ